MSEVRRGRPPVEKVRLYCRGEGCTNFRDLPPSSARQRSTGSIVCDECRAKGVGLKPRSFGQPPCEHCGCPIEWKRGPRKFHPECVVLARAAQVESTCEWCGDPIVASRSRTRKFHTTVAPEPEGGWPEGVRLTCADFGRYKNPARPLRFVNGKLARYHDDGEHLLAWNGRGWVLEHRMVAEPVACRCGHLDVFHVDGRCTFDLWGESLWLGDLESLKSCACTRWESYGPLPELVVVHHGPGGPADNRPENLMVMSGKEHADLHNAITKAKLGEAEAIIAAARLRAKGYVPVSEAIEHAKEILARYEPEALASPQ